MRIAIDALGIHYVGGGRSATLTLLEALFALDRDNQYLVFLTQAEPSLKTPTGNVQQRLVPIRNRFFTRLWAQAFLPRLVREFDLVHFAKNLGVFGLSVPSVVTMYDVTTLVHPELFPFADVWYWRTIQRRTLEAATQVIAISQNTAQDLIRFYNLPPERIRVIYPAISARFRPAGEQEIRSVQERYNLPASYLLHVGRIDKKKNLVRLVEAYARLLQRTGFRGSLVLVGEVYPKSQDEELVPTIERLGLNRQVIFTGKVPDEDLPAIYSGALASVFPSLHEGFGLTQVEAMACGSPMLTHRAGAAQEAVGEGALIVSNADTEPLADGLCRIVEDAELRAELRSRGLLRARDFSGEASARALLALYRDTAGQ